MVYELRTYWAHPGKEDAMHARFANHTINLFRAHGMTVVGFWSPVDARELHGDLVYLLAFPSHQERERMFNAFRDVAGFEAECLQGRDLGFDGKTLIHPDQVAVANRVFGPSAEELDLAQRQIAAYNAALANGQGVAVLDGKIVENLHILSAQALIAKARAIAAMQE